MSVIGDGEVSHKTGDKQDDGSNIEPPTPRQILASDTTQDDSDEEAEWSKCTVETEDDILPRAGTIGLTQQHQTSRQECRGSQTGKSSRDNEHLIVLTEATDQAPDAHPEQATGEDEEGSIHIGKAAEWQEKGAGNKREDAGRPCLGILGNI